ncbi:MAG: phosphoglycerate dehydrogenase [Propionibacteriaceae bacterium]|jgi:D-3-phosphoglycerate dehydrogenase|nr:phosphoglycerate dehydrogenase [Propionibacteriaceae bacterium]
MKVLVTPTSLTPESPLAALRRLRESVDEVQFNPARVPLEPAQLIPLLQDVDGVIAGLDQFSAEVLRAAGPRLRVISRYGTGCDRVDLAAAAERGIAVTTTPGANSVAVAELALGLMFALARRLPGLDRAVRAGGWPRSQGLELTGKTLGVIGLGAIGRNVASRAQALGMTVVGYDPFVADDAVVSAGVEPLPLPELLGRSDVVTLHVPLQGATRHLIDAGALAAMKPGALLLNTSRGGLVDERAAAAALESGHLGGLALDAYETEPPLGSPLFAYDNVIATPHTGAHTAEAVERMAEAAVTNLLAVLYHKGS